MMMGAMPQAPGMPVGQVPNANVAPLTPEQQQMVNQQIMVMQQQQIAFLQQQLYAQMQLGGAQPGGVAPNQGAPMAMPGFNYNPMAGFPQMPGM